MKIPPSPGIHMKKKERRTRSQTHASLHITPIHQLPAWRGSLSPFMHPPSHKVFGVTFRESLSRSIGNGHFNVMKNIATILLHLFRFLLSRNSFSPYRSLYGLFFNHIIVFQIFLMPLSLQHDLSRWGLNDVLMDFFIWQRSSYRLLCLLSFYVNFITTRRLFFTLCEIVLMWEKGIRRGQDE